MYTVKELSKRLRVSPSTIYNLVDAGKIPCYRIGCGRGAIRFDEEQITTALESFEVVRPDDDDGLLPHLL